MTGSSIARAGSCGKFAPLAQVGASLACDAARLRRSVVFAVTRRDVAFTHVGASLSFDTRCRVHPSRRVAFVRGSARARSPTWARCFHSILGRDADPPPDAAERRIWRRPPARSAKREDGRGGGNPHDQRRCEAATLPSRSDYLGARCRKRALRTGVRRGTRAIGARARARLGATIARRWSRVFGVVELSGPDEDGAVSGLENVSVFRGGLAPRRGSRGPLREATRARRTMREAVVRTRGGCGETRV